MRDEPLSHTSSSDPRQAQKAGAEPGLGGPSPIPQHKPGTRTGSRWQTLTERLLMASVLWALLVMFTGGYLLKETFRSHLYEELKASMDSVLNALEGGVQVSRDGNVELVRPIADQRFAEPASGWYFQIYDGDELALRSRSLWDTALETDMSKRRLRPAWRYAQSVDDQKLYILEQDLVLPEVGHAYRFMVAVDIAPIHAKIARYNINLWAALLIMGAMIVIAMWLQVAYGLRPLKRLQRGLREIRHGRAQTLPGDWGADLGPVAQEINRLSSQNQRTIERTRTYVGNLAHALKTPLAVIANEARGLDASGNDAGKRIQSQLAQLEKATARYLKRARIAGGSGGVGTPVGGRLRKLARVITDLHKDKDLVVDLDVDDGLIYAGEMEDFDEALGNILDNAGKWARSEIAITAHPDTLDGRSMVAITIGDDGAGVPAKERAALFERGQRLDEAVSGSGLGLAIVREIVDLSGGRVRLADSALGGLHVEILLPAKD